MIGYIQQLIFEHANKIPFLLLGTEGVKVRLSTQRIIEAVVIGAVIAGLGYVAVIPKMEEHMTLQFRHINNELYEIKTKMDDIEKKVEQDYRELSKELRKSNR